MRAAFYTGYIHYRPVLTGGTAKYMQRYANYKASFPVASCTNFSTCVGYNAKPDATTNIMNVFDRSSKRRQRNYTAKLEYKVFDYIKDEAGWRLADRISDIKRDFDVVVELGCGRGHIGQHILSDMAGVLYQTDMAEKVLAQSEKSPEVPTLRIHMDEEWIPFRHGTLDLVVSSLSLHWVNDLPGTFIQVRNALKNDGCFLGSLFGGDTLFELRSSLLKAEMEIERGVGNHISPFTTSQDLGNLLSRAGFTMLTIDTDEIVVRYPSMMALMKDLQGMGENNAAWTRKTHLHRKTMKAAEDIYKDMYSSDNGESIPATYQIISFIGWKPDPSQPKPAKRGSGQISIQDIDKLDDITRQLEQKANNQAQKSTAEQQTADDINRLRQYTEQLREEMENKDDSKF